jgi:tetratricopeptide (TPR) repeat protein
MKKVLALLWMASVALAGAQSTPNITAPAASPAEQSIAAAQRIIQEKPAQNTGYNLLAVALLRRARETSDASYYPQADEAVKKSLQLLPKDFESRKIQVSILLGEHEFPAALDAAKALNKQVPDDVMVYGLLTDAYAELGNYKDAETSAQWMLNLRPGNLPALVNAARLREVFGDLDGSFELLQLAYESTPPTEIEERAWLLARMGHLRLASGDAAAADKLLQQALAAFPNYPWALSGLAEVRSSQSRYDEAVVLSRQLYQSSPRTENLFDLAQALRRAGRQDEAKKAFAEFEARSLRKSDTKDNTNRQLVFYYADIVKNPISALKIADEEYAWRRDIYTLDAYAWALHVNGRDVEARKQIEAALAVGVRDAKLFRHAGEIVLKSGDRESARRYFKLSAELNTAESEQAKITLASLAKAGRR